MISEKTLDQAGYLVAQRLARINYLLELTDAARLGTFQQRKTATNRARREAARWGVDTEEIDRRLLMRRHNQKENT